MEFGVLGPLTVWRAGVSLDLGTPKARVLLAVLLCRLGRPVSGDALAEAIWGEEQPKSAAKNVQTYVHRLRRSLGDPGRITREGSGYVLRAGRDELDATRFEDLAVLARTALVAGELEQSRRLFDEGPEPLPGARVRRDRRRLRAGRGGRTPGRTAAPRT